MFSGVVYSRARIQPSSRFAIALVHLFWYIDPGMAESLKPIPLVFWRSLTGREPVRDWLNELSREDKRTIGRDMAKVQYGWPMGLPLCRPLSAGLWEMRASLPSKREARIFFGFHDGTLIAVHAMIKKVQKTPAEDLALARQRFKELQAWQGKTRT